MKNKINHQKECLENRLCHQFNYFGELICVPATDEDVKCKYLLKPDNRCTYFNLIKYGNKKNE